MPPIRKRRKLVIRPPPRPATIQSNAKLFGKGQRPIRSHCSRSSCPSQQSDCGSPRLMEFDADLMRPKSCKRAYLGTELRGLRDMNRNVIAHVAFVNRGNLPARKIRNAVKIGWSSDGDKRSLRKSKSSIRALSSCCRRLKQNGERERFPLPTSLNLKLTRGSYMSGAGSNTTMDLVASRDG